MPTVLLLDVSISMAHSIFKTNSNSGSSISNNSSLVTNETTTTTTTNEEEIKTFFDVLKSTIQYFITTLQSKISAFMTDPITLITYSSDVNVSIPFTTEFQNFVNEFITMDIRLSDRTDLLNALNKTNSIIQSAFGDACSISTEIFIFTDQCTAFDEDHDSPFYLKLKQFHFPYIHQFHFISICIKENHSHSNHHSHNQKNLILLDGSSNSNNNYINNDNNNSNIQNSCSIGSKNNTVRINNYFRGTVDIIKLNNQIINNSSNIVLLNTELNNIIDRIITTNYNLYRSVLAFGRLSSPITLYPNPMTLLNFLNANIKSISALSIIGYLPNKSLYNVPSLSRHVIIPLVSDSLPGHLPPLGPVLQNCLRNEKKTAIVYIQDNWYGMINSTFENDVPVLALSLFEQGLDLPFLGEDLSCLEIGNLNDHIQQQQQQQLLQQQQQLQSGQKQQIQLTPPQLPFTAAQSPFTMSYNTVVDPNIIPYIKMDSIHSDFSKISRLFKNLPHKLESIINECEKIRALSLIYQPNLIKALKILLTEEIKANKIPDERTYYFLAELVLFLENPSEPINAISLANSINDKNPQIQQQQHQHQQHQQHQQQQYQQHQQHQQHQQDQHQQPYQQHQQQQQAQQYQQHQQHQQQYQQQYQQSSQHSSYHGSNSSSSSGRDHSSSTSSRHSSSSSGSSSSSSSSSSSNGGGGGSGSSNNNRGRKEKKQKY